MTPNAQFIITSRLVGMGTARLRRLRDFAEDRTSECARFIFRVASEDLHDRLGDQRRVYLSDVQQPHQEF